MNKRPPTCGAFQAVLDTFHSVNWTTESQGRDLLFWDLGRGQRAGRVIPSYVATTLEDGRFDVSFCPAQRFTWWRSATRTGITRGSLGRGRAGAAGFDDGHHVMVAVVWDHAGTFHPYMSEAVQDEWGWATWRLSEPWSKSDSLEWLIPSDKVLQPSELPPFDGTVHARGWGSDMDSADVQVVWHRAPVWGQRQGRTDTMAVPRPRLMDTDSLRLLAKPRGRLMPDEGPVFGLSAPLDSLDPTQVTVWVDSVEVEAEWELTWSQLKLNSPPVQRPGKSVQVSFRPGALVREDAQAMWPLDTLDLVWSTLPQDALSTWRLTLEDVVCSGWLEVALGPDQVDLVRIQEDTTLTWSGLKPKSLNATWWGDSNGNGVWEQVSVARWTAPEPVLHLEPVALRANWEVETVWRLDSAACARGVLSR